MRIMLLKPSSSNMSSLHNEIHSLTDTLEHSRDFLFQRGVLKATMSCAACSASMTLTSCSSTKSPDLLIWKCYPCKTYRNIRTDSILSGQKLSLQTFLLLIFYLSVKSLASVAIHQLIGISENTISEWKVLLHIRVSNWLMANPSPLGGLGVVVELDEAKFGKRKYNKGSYREGMWVLGAVDRNTGKCFLLPCPGNRRDAATLLPLIQRWILPGSIIHTDEWAAYNGLASSGYTHNTVNHSLQFVDPATGVHTNTQEGLWAHVKKSVVGSTNLELALINFMFQRRLDSTGGTNQISRCFNGYLTVLKAD